MKQIPYGITDFSRIQKENYYYVDKTMFIEKIEMQPPYLFLIRPRRFGKSLTLAMLEAYYDVNHAEQFDELFGQLYIGQHPTKLHNQFLIMRFLSIYLSLISADFFQYSANGVLTQHTFHPFLLKDARRVQ